jgi:predicted DNA-binding protein
MNTENIQSESKTLLQVRIPTKLKNRLIYIAKIRGLSQADLVREFILKALAELSYLTEEEKKALGICSHFRNSFERECVL